MLSILGAVLFGVIAIMTVLVACGFSGRIYNGWTT